MIGPEQGDLEKFGAEKINNLEKDIFAKELLTIRTEIFREDKNEKLHEIEAKCAEITEKVKKEYPETNTLKEKDPEAARLIGEALALIKKANKIHREIGSHSKTIDDLQTEIEKLKKRIESVKTQIFPRKPANN